MGKPEPWEDSSLEITDTPGYWRWKKPCGGRAGGCPSLLHWLLFCEGPTRHTVSYFDSSRGEDGRFTSPYRTWRRVKAGVPE